MHNSAYRRWMSFWCYSSAPFLCRSKQVRVNWKDVTKSGSTVKTGDVISVRGKGRVDVRSSTLTRILPWILYSSVYTLGDASSGVSLGQLKLARKCYSLGKCLSKLEGRCRTRGLDGDLTFCLVCWVESCSRRYHSGSEMYLRLEEGVARFEP